MKQSNYAYLGSFVTSREELIEAPATFAYKEEPPAVDPILSAFLVLGGIILFGYVIMKAK